MLNFCVISSLIFSAFFVFVFLFEVLPCYNRTAYLGVKYQFTYLFEVVHSMFVSICFISVFVFCFHFHHYFSLSFLFGFVLFSPSFLCFLCWSFLSFWFISFFVLLGTKFVYVCALFAVKQDFLLEQMATLYKIVHIVNFNTSVQALMLLHQVVDPR